MPPRRAQLGGMYGGGVQRQPQQGADYSSLVDAVLGGSANLLQITTARKLAERAAKAKEAADIQARNDKQAEQAANEAYRRDMMAQQQQNFAAQQAAQHDDRWNTNARLNAQDEFQRDRAAKQDEAAAAKAKLPVAPVRGTPEYLKMIEDEERVKQKFAPRKEPKEKTPHYVKGNDGLYEVMQLNGRPYYRKVQAVGSDADVAPPPAAQPAAQPSPMLPGVNPLTGQAAPRQMMGATIPATPRMGAAPTADPFGRPTVTGTGRVPPKFAADLTTLDNMKSVLDNYETALDKNGTALYTGKNPKAADVDGAYMAAVMQLKNANDLGVLNGRDYELLNKQLQGPVGPGAVYHGKDVIKAQIKQVRTFLDNKRKALYNAYQQQLPPDDAPHLQPDVIDPENIFGGPP